MRSLAAHVRLHGVDLSRFRSSIPAASCTLLRALSMPRVSGMRSLSFVSPSVSSNRSAIARPMNSFSSCSVYVMSNATSLSSSFLVNFIVYASISSAFLISISVSTSIALKSLRIDSFRDSFGIPIV